MTDNKDFLHFSLPCIEDEEIEEVIDTLKSGWITTGPKVKKFEDEFARYIGCKNAVAVNSCTAALHLALDAIGLKAGDKVITTPMTFAATAEVIRYFNATPVFVDIDPVTMNIDVDQTEKYLSSLDKKDSSFPKAIIPVHYTGLPCNMDHIQKLADTYQLKVIEDAAHALPASYKGRMIGTISDITCFSFYATKNITTGEGGMITTDNDEWADRMRVMSLHGISKDSWERYTAEGNWYYEIMAPGYKYNLTDIAASLGLVQLKKADLFWKRRAQIAEKYNEAFEGVPEVETPYVEKEDVEHSWHLYILKLNLESLSIDRNHFINELTSRGIGTSVHFIPLHIHPYYRETFQYKPEDYPVSYDIYKRIISLPIYPKMKDHDTQRVINAVLDIIDNYRRLI